jgi:hypothetical protein
MVRFWGSWRKDENQAKSRPLVGEIERALDRVDISMRTVV